MILLKVYFSFRSIFKILHNALIKKRFNVFYRMLIEFSLKKQQSQGLIAFYSILIDILNRFSL